MPLYDYKCSNCGTLREVRHGFNDVYQEPCAECGAGMVRVFNPAPVVFKGSGFYITDSRKSSSSSNGETKSETKPEAKSDAKTETKSDAKSESSSPAPAGESAA